MPTDKPAPTPTRPLTSALSMVDLQDHLLTAAHDLARLEFLLEEACQRLLARFGEAADELQRLPVAGTAAGERVRERIAAAVTALQFQDLASQLIAHTRGRLDHCSDRLASAAFGDSEGEGDDDSDGDVLVRAAPLRPNPVTQAEMAAGSVELF